MKMKWMGCAGTTREDQQQPHIADMFDRMHRKAGPRRDRNAAMVHRMHALVDPRDVQRAVEPVEMEGIERRALTGRGHEEPDRIAFNRDHPGPAIGISHPDNHIIERPERHP